jgi:hypothetical protein
LVFDFFAERIHKCATKHWVGFVVRANKLVSEPSTTESEVSPAQKEFFLIGDSHSGTIGYAARKLGMDFRGGPVASGRQLESVFFRIQDNRFLITLDGRASTKRVERFENLLAFEGPILSTVGFNTHTFVGPAVEYSKKTGVSLGDMSSGAFAQWVRDERDGALQFYSTMANHSRKVFFTVSPQRFADSEEKEIGRRFESVLITAIAGMGAKFIDVREETCDAEGILLPELASRGKRDTNHASIEWGRLVLAKFSKMAWGAHIISAPPEFSPVEPLL